jgi:hypothetical protein
MRSLRLAFRGAKFALPLALLAQACLLVSPLDDVSEGQGDDDVGVGNGDTPNLPSTGGTYSLGSGGTANSGTGNSGGGAGGRLETGTGGNIGIGANGGSGGGAGGTENAPSNVSSWCPDPVALVAQSNPYIASFTFVSGDCGELNDVEYRAGVASAPNCTIAEERLSPEFCAYQEVETCTDVMADATTTADAESRALILVIEPGGPIVGTAELSIDFYALGEYVASCSGTYDVTYTPQGGQ